MCETDTLSLKNCTILLHQSQTLRNACLKRQTSITNPCKKHPPFITLKNTHIFKVWDRTLPSDTPNEETSTKTIGKGEKQSTQYYPLKATSAPPQRTQHKPLPGGACFQTGSNQAHENTASGYLPDVHTPQPSGNSGHSEQLSCLGRASSNSVLVQSMVPAWNTSFLFYFVQEANLEI